MTDNAAKTQEAEVELDANLSSKFTVKPSTLKLVVSILKNRSFSEEVDKLEKLAQQADGESVTDYNSWLMKGLNTSKENGLDESDFTERETSFGHNRRVIVATKGFCQLFYDALNDLTLKILIACAILSIIIQMSVSDDEEREIAWIEGFAILVAVFVCSIVAAGNDYQKEKQFQELNQVSDKMRQVNVIRKGKRISIHRDDIMVGDVVVLISGMELPSDGIVLEGQDVTTDESVMTGEPDPVPKQPLVNCIKERNRILAENRGANEMNRHEVPSPVVMSGTNVLSGEGLFLVTVIGKNSCQGEIEAKLQQKEESETPLQQKLTVIAEDIGKFGGISALIIIFVMLVRFIIERIIEGEFEGEHAVEILDFFIIGVTVVVVAIPEGLPLSVTLSLAFSTKKMLKDKNLVRKLQACETMGGANNICSDKTGTLTMNKMDLTMIWNYDTKEINTTAQKLEINDYVPKSAVDVLLMNISVNNAAEITEKTDENGKPLLDDKGVQQVQELGSATELAFLKFMKKCGIDRHEFDKKYQVTYKVPFSSSRKMQSRVILLEGKRRLLINGASEIVLSGCNKIHNWNTGNQDEITPDVKSKVEGAINKYAEEAMRTICVAYKDLGSNEADMEPVDSKGVREIEKSELVLVAICGIRDNLRDKVPEAVAQCQKSGITVRMVTGDNPVTAQAIATNCNIFRKSEGHQVILGEDFMNKVGPIVCKACQTVSCGCPINEEQEEEGENNEKAKKEKGKEENYKDEEAQKKKKTIRQDVLKNQKIFREIYPKITVMARSRPEDKYAFVLGLKEERQVVAVTGDGTNDSTALKKADVGFAMGIAGTQLAKDASDIILTDDNFASIVKAVLWGRNIYDSIRKFLQFQLTVNVVAVVVTLVGAAISKQDFLKPIQMLWVNLIMDTFASLALATEPPIDKLLDRPPHSRDDYIVSKKMAKHIIFQSIYQLIIVLFLSFNGENFIREWRDDFDDSKDFLLKYKYNLRKLDINEYLDNSDGPFYVTSGRHRSYNGLDEEYSKDAEKETPSRHFTFLFNTFVMMQFFNFINARKIEDEYNLFAGIFNNWMFFAILLIIIVLQIIFITFGGRALDCYIYDGLRLEHWGVCILFGIGGNIVNLLVKPIPEEKLLFCKKKAPKTEDGNDSQEQQDKQNGVLRKSSVLDLKGERIRRMSSQLDKNQKRKFSNASQIKAKQGAAGTGGGNEGVSTQQQQQQNQQPTLNTNVNNTEKVSENQLLQQQPQQPVNTYQQQGMVE